MQPTSIWPYFSSFDTVLVPVLNLVLSDMKVLNLVPVLVPVYTAKLEQKWFKRQPAIIRPLDEVQTAIRAGQASRPKSGRSHKP